MDFQIICVTYVRYVVPIVKTYPVNAINPLLLFNR